MRKFVKISALIISFVFLSGFIPFAAIFGPAATIFSTGNVYKAGLQILVDQGIQKKTGKNSLTLVKEEIEKKEAEKNLQKELRILVEKRIKITRQKLDLGKINQ